MGTGEWSKFVFSGLSLSSRASLRLIASISDSVKTDYLGLLWKVTFFIVLMLMTSS